MVTQRLCCGVLLRQFGFCEQGMNLFVARSVHEHRDFATSRFGNQMVGVAQGWRDRPITEHTHLQFGAFEVLDLSARLGLQPFDTPLSHGC